MPAALRILQLALSGREVGYRNLPLSIPTALEEAKIEGIHGIATAIPLPVDS
jgi:hypothetical protein